MNERCDSLFAAQTVQTLSPQTRAIAQTLYGWLESRLSPSASSWLQSVLTQNLKPGAERLLFARFSEVPRRTGKADLHLTTAEKQAMVPILPDWTPVDWSIDQATRTLLLITFVPAKPEDHLPTLLKLLSAADMAEQVAWYQSLPVLPNPEQYEQQAVEGLRTNMKVVFEAIALHNPYPAQYFDELAWNQMVLKALFIDSPLSRIQGLEERANPTLARMLRDYAHERWAAGREVNPQLWRLVGPFAEDDFKADLEKVLNHPSAPTQQAAALACAQAPSSDVQALLQTVPHLQQRITAQDLTWEVVSQAAP